MKEYIKPLLINLNIVSNEIITSTSIRFDNNIYKDTDEVVEWEDLFK